MCSRGMQSLKKLNRPRTAFIFWSSRQRSNDSSIGCKMRRRTRMLKMPEKCTVILMGYLWISLWPLNQIINHLLLKPNRHHSLRDSNKLRQRVHPETTQCRTSSVTPTLWTSSCRQWVTNSSNKCNHHLVFHRSSKLSIFWDLSRMTLRWDDSWLNSCPKASRTRRDSERTSSRLSWDKPCKLWLKPSRATRSHSSWHPSDSALTPSTPQKTEWRPS